MVDFVVLFLESLLHMSVADPGFPVGGCGPRRGALDSRGGYASKILYVKTKEFGPFGGHGPSRPL